MSNAYESKEFDFSRAKSRVNSRGYDSRGGVSNLPSLPVVSTPSPEVPDQIALDSDAFNIPEQSYVEFDMQSLKNGSQEDFLKQKYFRSHDHINEIVEEEVPIETKKVIDTKKEDDFFNSDDNQWKSMEKVTKGNYYDEMGNLEFQNHSFNWNSLNDGRGYTKIDTEEQLNKYAELDKKTNFLFEIQNSKEPSLPTVEEEEEVFDHGDEVIDSDETLAGTRGMLTDSQKFAYIGIIKLITVDMATDLARLNRRTTNKVALKLTLSQKNFANWTMYIMAKLVEHLKLTKEEQTMIDNLSAHGVEVQDLTTSLLETQIRDQNLEKLVQDFDLRWVLICDLFLLLLADGYYDSRSRTLLVKFAEYLQITKLEVRQFERRLVESLEMDTTQKTIEGREDKLKDRLFIEKHIQKNKKKRMAYIGLATLGGSLAIGLSAGLLAPVIGAGLAAGLTTVGISGTGGFLAGVGGSVAITTGGVAVGAKVGSKAGSRRLGDVHTFELKPLHNNRHSNLIITVSGWMNGAMDDVRLPFSTVDPVMGDMFSLLWEPEMLQSMGQTIGILASEALSTSIQQILGATILTALMSAIQLPMALSKLSYLLDNPWNVSLDRAWKAGKILADTLIAGNMGVRPITLVGFSLGSRLIYSCLIELANRGGFGLIENVILLGNPATVKYDQITLARSVVSGKFINGHSKNDWILGYLFRATGGGLLTVAGISPIENIPGVDNFNCTEFIEGHMSYRQAIPRILKALDWEVLSEEFAEIEEPDGEQTERQRQLINEFDEARAKMEKEIEETKDNQKTWKDWFKPKQQKWWDVYDKSGVDTDLRSKAEFEEYTVSQPNQSAHVGNDDFTTGESGTGHQETAANEAIFDVNALLHEVNDIEKIGEENQDTLSKLRQDVDNTQYELKTNEDTEGTEPAGMIDKLGKLASPIKKPFV
ncbi:CIC11C00000003643 [Sungouiella intermedia]|uniref:CIC11C00000003643 n=1 Tax=Sungouiella intermedia TaxID=45354 RepID=A0A1L0E016_9ASCO|nr:CIC11C00000003643 [[Candida] intermedia]